MIHQYNSEKELLGELPKDVLAPLNHFEEVTLKEIIEKYSIGKCLLKKKR